MKIVTLGGNGFIGSNICRYMSDNDFEVVSVSRSVARETGNGKVTFYQSTLDNTEIIKRIISNGDIVIHTASDTTPGTSAQQPSLEALNNITPTLRLMECLHERSDILLIYFSSGGAIYDASCKPPYTEDSPVAPKSYYGAAKLATENFIKAHVNQSKNRAVILRPSNVYGPDQIAKRSFGIVPTILERLESNRPFNIWGDGTTIRDYVYIDDLLHFCSCLLMNLQSLHSYNTFNVGSGEGHSIFDLCNIAEETTGRTLLRKHLVSREIDMPSVVLDSTYAKKELDWTPKISLRNGMERIWQARQMQ